jgi:hypothetical protein
VAENTQSTHYTKQVDKTVGKGFSPESIDTMYSLAESENASEKAKNLARKFPKGKVNAKQMGELFRELSNTMGAGSVMLLTPANDATKEAASKAHLTVSVDISGDSGGTTKDYVVLLRAETAAKPAIDMEFAYVILQTTAATSLVTLIGVDAAGGTEPTLVDLSGFEGVEQEDGSIKGVIVETYADETTRTTEVTYDGEGNIVQIGETVIRWTAAGEEG